MRHHCYRLILSWHLSRIVEAEEYLRPEGWVCLITNLLFHHQGTGPVSP